MRGTSRPTVSDRRVGTFAFCGSPLLPGVQILRMEDFIKEFYVHLDFYDITLVLKSLGRVRYRRRVFESGRERIFLGEPGELLASDPRETPESIRCLLIGAREFESLAAELGHPAGPVHFNPVISDDPMVARPLLRFTQALESRASALEVQSRYVVAMRRILERTGTSAPADVSRGREDDAVRRACRTLEERLAENVTLDELALQAGLSRLKFFRAFQRVTGVPPHEYQIQRRVAAARTRLARQEPVIDVAFDLGFADQAHFTRHFRRIMGLPPKAFARSFAPTWSVPV
jgi:methylphosphotriester-DNA--protein-cysteine methyltransferase